MTDEDYQRCLRVLHSWQAPHNVRHCTTKAGIVRSFVDVVVVVHGELATFDADGLTRLVVSAHRERVRLSINGRRKGYLELAFHPRSSDGQIYQRHPGVEALVTTR